MRANIHPEYTEIKVTCSCGHKFVTSSTLCKDLNVEVCNECHPFYTGKQKIVDTAGRVERFKGKFAGFAVNRKEGSEGSEKEASTSTSTSTGTSTGGGKADSGKVAASGKADSGKTNSGKAASGKTDSKKSK